MPDSRRQVVAGDVIDAREAAALLRVTVDTVYARLRDGRLPGRNLGTDKRALWRLSRRR
nr:hypothetical protein [Deltaproteobacteria bacterium]